MWGGYFLLKRIRKDRDSRGGGEGRDRMGGETTQGMKERGKGKGWRRGKNGEGSRKMMRKKI